MNEAHSCPETAGTYFYIFIGSSGESRIIRGEQSLAENDTAAKGPSDAGDSPSQRDGIVVNAFRQLAGSFGTEVCVRLNPKDFWKALDVFGIRRIPAFGVTNFDVYAQPLDQLKDSPAPPLWKVWRWSERRNVKERQRALVSVERGLLNAYKDVVALRDFLTDIHVENTRHGQQAMLNRIDSEWATHTGKKFMGIKKKIWG